MQPNNELRKNSIKYLRELCRKSGQLPPSLSITEGLRRGGDHPLAGGGFADVWKGDLDEHGTVAIKVLRLFSNDPVHEAKTRKV
jgi:hypothetical protein